MPRRRMLRGKALLDALIRKHGLTKGIQKFERIRFGKKTRFKVRK